MSGRVPCKRDAMTVPTIPINRLTAKTSRLQTKVTNKTRASTPYQWGSGSLESEDMFMLYTDSSTVESIALERAKRFQRFHSKGSPHTLNSYKIRIHSPRFRGSDQAGSRIACAVWT